MAAASIKKYCRDLPISLFTDIHVSDHAFFDSVYNIDKPHNRSRLESFMRSPYERTLALDTDVKINADITNVFPILQDYDIAFSYAICGVRDKYKKLIPEYSDLPEYLSELNGGVILYKINDRTKRFFNDWIHLY